MTEAKEAITVNGETVSAGQTVSHSYTFPRGGVINSLDITCYTGQEFDLRYSVYLITTDGGINHLVEEISPTAWIGGNGDEYEFDIRQEVSQNDELVIEIENVESQFDYTANIRVGVDYAPQPLDRLREVFN